MSFFNGLLPTYLTTWFFQWPQKCSGRIRIRILNLLIQGNGSPNPVQKETGIYRSTTLEYTVHPITWSKHTVKRWSKPVWNIFILLDGLDNGPNWYSIIYLSLTRARKLPFLNVLDNGHMSFIKPPATPPNKSIGANTNKLTEEICTAHCYWKHL